MSNAYDSAHYQSIHDPHGFWGRIAEECHWTRTWDKVLDDSRKPFYRWFTGGELNTCYNALDLHVESGRADQPALIYDSPVTQTVKRFTYRELRDATARFAGALAAQGVRKGDRVVIYMPMIPEAVIAARELAVRINDAKPKVMVSASCGIEINRVIPYKPLLDGAIDMADAKPERCIIVQRPMQAAEMKPGRDLDWNEVMAKAQPHDCVPVKATDPLYILYTSGTTGIPKGVVRDNGGHVVALKYTMKAIYNVEAGDVYWAASDVGWVVGHSYIVYAPLFKGCTSILYEGKPVGTPDAGAFWRVISQHKVKCLFTAPTAFRAIKREDPNAEKMKQYDLSGFKALFLAGERLDPDTLRWAQNSLRVPVIDHWWQTETGWAIAANCMGLHHFPVKEGSPTKPAPGWNLAVLNVDKRPAEAPAHVVEQRRGVFEVLHGGVPRLLQDRGRRLHRPGGLRLRHVAHRRHHQRGRAPALDRGHGGGPLRPPGRGRVCGPRRRGRVKRPGAHRVPGAQGRRHPQGGGDRQGGGPDGARPHRAGGLLQDRHGGQAAAQDPLREDPARHDPEDRRQRNFPGAHLPGLRPGAQGLSRVRIGMHPTAFGGGTVPRRGYRLRFVNGNTYDRRRTAVGRNHGSERLSPRSG